MFYALTYFSVHKVATIDVTKFRLPSSYGHFIYLISFSTMHLECPSSEPIAMYYGIGYRRFIWMDRYWAEVNIDYFDIVSKELVLQTDKNLLELLELYRVSKQPTLDANADADVFCRALYRVYEK